MPQMESDLLTICLDFQKSSRNPTRILRAGQDLIESLESLDKVLIKGFHSDLKPELFLEDLTSGSLTIWLAQRFYQALDSVPEETLASGEPKKVLGAFLVKAKHRLASFVQNREGIENREELQSLSSEISALAETLPMPVLPLYHPPTSSELLEVLQLVSRGLETLQDGDRVVIGSIDGDVEVCSTFRVTDGDINRLLVREEIENQVPIEMILQVRKPDFFGSAQWEFRWSGQPFKARIEDRNWLARFLSKRVDIKPGDAIRAMVSSRAAYGWENEVIHQQHSVMEVLGVIPGEIPIEEAFLGD